MKFPFEWWEILNGECDSFFQSIATFPHAFDHCLFPGQSLSFHKPPYLHVSTYRCLHPTRGIYTPTYSTLLHVLSPRCLHTHTWVHTYTPTHLHACILHGSVPPNLHVSRSPYLQRERKYLRACMSLIPPWLDASTPTCADTRLHTERLHTSLPPYAHLHLAQWRSRRKNQELKMEINMHTNKGTNA